MLKIFTYAFLGTCALLAAAHPAGAATLFSNDFAQGISPREDLVGNFSVADGYLGHHNGYTNN